MNKCIYTNKDDSNATFKSAEHVFPKCIGGQYCLPRGFVSDQINNEFSRIELTFARENPIIVLNRMFYKKVGRSKHKNRDKISIFRDTGTSKLSLGYITNAKPICLDQLILPDITEKSLEDKITYDIRLSPSLEVTNREKVNSFFEKLNSYNNCPTCIKKEYVPVNTYLLGFKDNKWFLGINSTENPETVKPIIKKVVDKLIEKKNNVLSESENTQVSHSRIKAHFEYGINLIDTMRVYAKIAFNAFAALNTHEHILSDDFNVIRNAICTGKGILDIAYFCKEGISIKPIFDKFDNEVKLGEHFHSITFVTKERIIYAFVALYGTVSPVQIKIGPCNKHYTDIFICDWENQKDYKLIDYVVEVCKSNHEDDL